MKTVARKQTIALLGMCLVGWVLLTTGWLPQPHAAFGQPSRIPNSGEPGELIALSSDTADGRQQVTVIDSKTRSMSVYHIDHTTGAITLKSVRSIEADLLMDEFNTDSPLPREIRAMLKKQG